MKKRNRGREERPPRSPSLLAAFILAAVCVVVSIGAGGAYMVMLFESSMPIAEDDDGRSVRVDELRQVVLHYDDDTWLEHVMHGDHVDQFIRGVRQLDDEHVTGITVYRMRRSWPSGWTTDERRTLFGDGHAPVYDWSLHESTVQFNE